MTKQQERKQTIRAFMRANYTDERLAWLLAYAREGKLAYYSCCCFIGIPTSDHSLKGVSDYTTIDHYMTSSLHLVGAGPANAAYANLGNGRYDGIFPASHDRLDSGIADARRIRILIPIIRAEQRRRETDQRLTIREALCETLA